MGYSKSPAIPASSFRLTTNHKPKGLPSSSPWLAQPRVSPSKQPHSPPNPNGVPSPATLPRGLLPARPFSPHHPAKTPAPHPQHTCHEIQKPKPKAIDPFKAKIIQGTFQCHPHPPPQKQPIKDVWPHLFGEPPKHHCPESNHQHSKYNTDDGQSRHLEPGSKQAAFLQVKFPRSVWRFLTR
jgi:hypothetical protein